MVGAYLTADLAEGEKLTGKIKLVPLLSRRKAICGSSFFGFSGRNKLAKQAGAEPRSRRGGRGGRSVRGSSDRCHRLQFTPWSTAMRAEGA